VVGVGPPRGPTGAEVAVPPPGCDDVVDCPVVAVVPVGSEVVEPWPPSGVVVEDTGGPVVLLSGATVVVEPWPPSGVVVEDTGGPVVVLCGPVVVLSGATVVVEP
jgi:hypothetical protein